MKFTNPNVIKYYKSRLIYKLIGGICYFSAVILAMFGWINAKKLIANEKSFADVYTEMYDTGRYNQYHVAYLDITDIMPFAINDDTKESYDFVYDGEYFYVVCMKTTEENKVFERFDNGEETIRLRGITRQFDNKEVRRLAVTALNEVYPEDEALTDETLDEVSGWLELDVVNVNIFSVMLKRVGKVGIYIFGGLIAAGIVFSNSKKKILKRYEAVPYEIASGLDEEMSSPEAVFFPTIGIYAGPNYLIGINCGIFSHKYEDLLMLYKQVNRNNGIKTSEDIMVMHKEGIDGISRVKISGIQAEKSETVNEEVARLGEIIKEHNADVYCGYDQYVFNALKAKAEKEYFEKNNAL